MHKNHAIYIGPSNSNPYSKPHDYAEASELYLIFAEITRIVARKVNRDIFGVA